MNAPYSFNFKYDSILENPFRSEIDYISIGAFIISVKKILLKCK